MYSHPVTRHAPIKYALITILTIVLAGCLGSGGSGAEAIRVTITAPAVGATLETPDETVTLTGTAESNAEVVSVSWKNDRGGEGDASGGEFWKTGTIPLKMGENSITITAKDSAGETASRIVVIVREGGGSGSVTLSWTAPTTREDGTPLTDLAGYYIRYGRMSKIYDEQIKIENPGIVTYVVEDLRPGKWYFVASAYDSSGQESNLSNQVKYKVH
jgi:hypothetical protein